MPRKAPSKPKRNTISNKALLAAVEKANKYIRTLKQQDLTESAAYKKLHEAANRAATGSKPRTYFPTVRVGAGGKISKKQRDKLLKSYKEIKLHESMFKQGIQNIKAHPQRTYTMTDRAEKIRQSDADYFTKKIKQRRNMKISDKWQLDEKIFTDKFYDFINSDEVQKLYEEFGSSDFLEELVDEIDKDPTILDDLDMLQEHLAAYLNNPHRDQFYEEEFADIIQYFRYGQGMK